MPELPQSFEAEKAVLCAIMLAPNEVLGICAEKGVNADSFSAPAHATIFSVLDGLWNENKPLVYLSIVERLKDSGKVESVGGYAYITEISTYSPTAANAEYYISIIQEKAQLRKIIAVCEEGAKQAYSVGANSEELLDTVEQDVLAIRSEHEITVNEASPKDAVMDVLANIQKLYDRRGKISGISTGFSELDKMTDGLHGAELFVIAARPSMGKTAFAMNIAEHIALHENKAVGVFSLEMSTSQLWTRLVSSVARVNLANIRDGFMSERDFPALQAAAARLAQSRIHVNDSSGISISALRAKARRMKQRHDIAAIVVDYLQLMKSTTRRAQDNRQLEISEISGGLKELSKELNIPVVVLAQLNRNPEKRSGSVKGRPMLSDLRESGSIEQDGDVVALLMRDEYYAETDKEKEDVKGCATLIIAKQRNGPVGDVKLTFLKEFARFEDRAEVPV